MKMLQEIKVIDLSTVLAGPSVASFLGELGARVLKLESPQNGGDVTRTWRIPGESLDTTVSAYFASINYCKTYATLDLSQVTSQERLFQELEDTDVFITNFKRGDAQKFGLEEQELQKKFPQLIQASITGFTSDPDRVAYDVVLQAECGMMAINGDADGLPTKFPLAIVDVLAAHQLKEAILLALYNRCKTGRGAIVSASLEKSGLSALINQASNYMMVGTVPQRMGSLHPNIAPYGEQFVCADGKSVVLAIGSDSQFKAFVELVGLPALQEDARFMSNAERVKHRTALYENLTASIGQLDSSALMESCIKMKIPVGLIRQMPEVVGIAEDLAMIHREEIAGVDTQRMKSVAFSIKD